MLVGFGELRTNKMEQSLVDGKKGISLKKGFIFTLQVADVDDCGDMVHYSYNSARFNQRKWTMGATE